MDDVTATVDELSVVEAVVEVALVNVVGWRLLVENVLVNSWLMSGTLVCRLGTLAMSNVRT